MKYIRQRASSFDYMWGRMQGCFLVLCCASLAIMLVACGNAATGQTVSAAAQRTPAFKGSSARELLPVVGSAPSFAGISFTASTSYATALQLVTDLGLQLQQPCQVVRTNAQGVTIAGLTWSPVGRKDEFKVTQGTSTHGTVGQTPTVTVERTLPELFVMVTPITPVDWIARLHATSIVSSIDTHVHLSCPNIGPVIGGGPVVPGGPIIVAGGTPTASSRITSIAPKQAGTYITATFSASTSYDEALYTASDMGFRLADPCYEQEAGKPADWHLMGEQQAFATTHTLTLATTDMSPTDWATRISKASNVIKSNVSYKAHCS